MAEIILDIKKLNKSFGPTHANVDIDFQLEAGEVRVLPGKMDLENRHFFHRLPECILMTVER